jgi:hypothetical protein
MEIGLREIVKEQYDYDIEDKLSDQNLYGKFIKQPSVKNKIKCVNVQLKNVLHDNEQIGKVMNIMTEFLIPPGTKGVIRGLEFNNIVKNTLEQNFNESNFDVCFEKHCLDVITQEKPDWWIRNKQNNKYVVGFNQIDLWTGGAQTNRANKYLSDSFHQSIPENSNVLCVISSRIVFGKRSSKNKIKLFYNAFKENRLCYIKTLVETVKKLLY